MTESGAVKTNRRGGAIPWIRDIAIAIVVAVIILQFIRPTVVNGTSMEPTLHSGDYIVLSKQSYNLFGAIEYGDTIVFETDESEGDVSLNAGEDFIKRVIGLPGDVIAISDGRIYRNGEPLDEPYIRNAATREFDDEVMVTVEEGTVFVLGDNREVSADSRDLGLIDQDAIKGKAVFKLYPFDDFGTITNPD